jgi:hypothetical protein
MQRGSGEHQNWPMRQAIFAIVCASVIWSSTATQATDALPVNVIITPRGNYTEDYRTPMHAQSVVIEVAFDGDGKTARASYGSGGDGGPGGMESWVAVAGGKRQIIKADWSIDNTLRKGVDVTIECGPTSSALKALKSVKSLSGTPRTPDEKEKLIEAIMPLPSDRLCKVTVSFETYGHYDVIYRFATVELSSN